MRTILLTLIAAIASLASAQPAHPNIILFIVDDLGWQDVSVPMWNERTPLNERYHTPNVERLAARGVRFSNSYASAPVCTPTRTSILTGMCPARTHITYWTLNKDSDTSTNRDDIAAPAWRVNGLQPGDYATLPQLMRDAGYRTIHVGKAHFGANGTPSADPTALGFDINIAGHAAGGPASYYGLDHFTVAGREGKPPHSSPTVWDTPGLDKYHGHDIFMTEALAIEASQAIRDAVADRKPFYMNFAPYAVHAPIMGNHRYEANYPDLDERERAYASMIETVDAALGSLVATLEDLHQIDNTVIIFSSDNGGLSAHARGLAPDGQTAHTHNAPARSGKGSAYEGGTRVPTVIAWPGVTDAPGRAGSTIDTPIISHDLFPTILHLAGVPLPPGETLDGRDLTPLLTGHADQFDASRILGWNQPHQWGASGPGIWPFTSIRVGDFKLIYFHAGRRFELYDLADDIGEARDLAPEMPGRVAELARAMDAWIDETGAQLSIDKSTGKEVKRPGVIAEGLVGGTPRTCVPVTSPETRSQAAGWGDRSWLDQFEDIRQGAKSLQPRLVLIGDSITQGWAGAARQVGGGGVAARERDLEPLGPVLNAGISGDRTQHVLWRLDHGMLEGAAPQAITLMIGTNNLPDDNAESIILGIDAILDRLRSSQPDAKILLIGVPPRGREPDDPLRIRGEIINHALAGRADAEHTFWLDLTPLLTDGDRRARPELMAGDFVHFSPAGYDVVARAMARALGDAGIR